MTRPVLRGAKDLIQLQDYADWLARCRTLGLDGPHELAGATSGEQFLDKTGTAAIWNAAARRGFIFVDEQGNIT